MKGRVDMSYRRYPTSELHLDTVGGDQLKG